MRWPLLAISLVACGGAAESDVLEIEHDDIEIASVKDIDGGEAEHEAEAVSGEATYYPVTPRGSCGASPSDRLIGALGPAMYSRAACGKCAQVTGPKGSVTVHINDKCPACKGASMDLTTPAFTQIADKSAGRVKIAWHYVDCP